LTVAETFREFYERRTGITYPARKGEQVDDVLRRMADVMADWADEIAERAATRGATVEQQAEWEPVVEHDGFVEVERKRHLVDAWLYRRWVRGQTEPTASWVQGDCHLSAEHSIVGAQDARSDLHTAAGNLTVGYTAQNLIQPPVAPRC
jgi:hypothetical protein